MLEQPNRQAEKSIEATTEKCKARIEILAASLEGIQIAFTDGCEHGVIEFFVIDDNFAITSKERHEAFISTLLIDDKTLSPECCEVIEESGADAFIRITL